MPNIHEMIPSKYLTKHDLETPKLWTIKNINMTQFQDGQTRWVISFVESTKAMTLNKTNIKSLANICESENSDDWIGKKVIVYFNEDITYKTEQVGGIRFKSRKQTFIPESAIADKKNESQFSEEDIGF